MEKQLLQLVRLALATALGLCGFVQGALAYTNVGLAHLLNDKSGISMECGLPMAEIPTSGYCPVHFRIKNNTNESHTWRVSFKFAGGGMARLGVSYSTQLAVGAGQTRDFDLLVPLPGLDSRERSYGMMRASVTGYGVNGGGDFHIPTHYSGGYRSSVYTAMSESLATPAWSKIDGEVKKSAAPEPIPDLAQLTSLRFPSGTGSRGGGRELSGAQVVLKELPADWRALAGVSGLWLSKSDWESLSSDRRRAIRQWVTAGGHLFVASGEDKIARLPLLPANLEVGKQELLGFGWIKAVKFTGGELSPVDTAFEILSLDSAPLPAWQEDYQQGWQFADYVGWPKLNVPLIIGFVALFAIVVGPLNLRWFAPPHRRSRLFFTIPLLSVAASVSLFGVIAFGDGFGGFGGRNALLYMPAAESQVTILQEQIARSRLLFTRAMRMPEAVQVSFAPQERQSDKGLSFTREGDVLSGDWFRSRTVQTHVLRSHTPSRAEVILQSGGAADAPPVLLSSAATILKDVHYVDASGRYWHAEKLETGRPAKLEPSTREAFDAWVNRVSDSLSRNFQAVVNQVIHRPGHFYASTDSMPEGPMETLSSLRWDKQNVLCFGTCKGAESK